MNKSISSKAQILIFSIEVCKPFKLPQSAQHLFPPEITFDQFAASWPTQQVKTSILFVWLVLVVEVVAE